MNKGLKAFKIMVKDNDLELTYHNTIFTIEQELKVLRRLKLLIERVDFIGDKHYIVLNDGHYIMISNNLYKILKEWLEDE